MKQMQLSPRSKAMLHTRLNTAPRRSVYENLNLHPCSQALLHTGLFTVVCRNVNETNAATSTLTTLVTH